MAMLAFGISSFIWQQMGLHNVFQANYSFIPISFVWFFLAPMIWVVVNLNLGVYEGQRNLIFAEEMLNITVGAFFSAGTIAGLLYLFDYPLPRSLFLEFSFFSFGLQILWRVGVRLFWHASRTMNRSRRVVLVIGAGDLGNQIANHILSEAQDELQFIGFLDDDPQKQTQKNVLGTLRDLSRVIESKKIDDVVVALPMYAYQKTTDLVISLRGRGVKVWMVPASFRLASYRVVVENFAGIPMFDLQAPAITSYQRLVKRLLDIILSILAILITAIPMLIIAILIKLDSPGSVIFRQKRVGESGRLFEMYKFRTMVQNAEEMRSQVERLDDNGKLIHKSPDDPRITRIGNMLRRISFDELPQFFNVLKGDMSVVGPRPELPYLVETYEPWQYARLTVPQGITGWWQVNGRSDKPMHLNTEDDLFYIKNYSLFLDIQIIAKTVFVIFLGKGAF